MFLALLFVLGASAAAIAAPGGTIMTSADIPANPGTPGLDRVGPVGDNGFPDWYRDGSGVRLEPCLDTNDPMCIMGALPADGAVTPNDVNGNFPDEFFYQAASAGIASVGKDTDPDPAKARFGTASLDASLEGAFLNGPPKAGDQMVFARLRLKITGGLEPSTQYRFIHPYGERTLKTDAGSDSLFVTEDIGATAGGFTEALKGRIAPFLQWTPDSRLPDGYTGDPNIDHAITGGVNNYFAIIGPGIGVGRPADGSEDCDKNGAPSSLMNAAGGNLNNCVYTSLFSLMGKKATNAGVDIKRPTYSRTSAGVATVDVLADSDNDQSIVVRDPNADRRITTGRLIPNTKMIGENGHYYAHVAVNGQFPTATDNTLEVVNATDAEPRKIKTITPADVITGTATFTAPDGTDPTSKGTLTVTAKSSDELADGGGTIAKLFVVDPATGQKVALDAAAAGAADPLAQSKTLDETTVPSTVTVTSSQLGEVSLPVQLAGPDRFTALKADAGGAHLVPSGKVGVKLSGTGSSGNIAKYEWTGPFQVDANGNLGDPVAAPAAGGPAEPALTDANSETATVNAPENTGTTNLQFGYKLTVTDDGGTTDVASTILSVKPATAPAAGGPVVTPAITPGKARFTVASQRWVVDGTAPIQSGTSVTIYLGGDHNSPERQLARVPVDPVDGSFVWDTGPGSTIIPAQVQEVSIVSSEAGVTPADHVAVDVRGDVTTLAPPAGQAPNVVAPQAIAGPTAVAAAGAAAGGAATAAAVPGVGALAPAPLRTIAAVTAPTVVTARAFGAGVPVTFTAPTTGIARLRVLTTAGKPLFQTFKKVKRGAKVKVLIKSAKLRRQVRAGKRYIIEVRAGTARNHLGKATRKVIRIRH